MSNSTTNLDQLATSDRAKEATINELFDAHSPSSLFGRQASECAALSWGWYGGAFRTGAGVIQIANGKQTLTASQTNYVEVDGAGVVTNNTTGFTPGRMPLYTVVCGTSTVTSYTDHRTGAVGEFVRSRHIVTLPYAAGVTVDWAAGYDVVRITLTGALALTFTNGIDGQVLILELTQGGAGGYSVTLPGDARFSSDIPNYVPSSSVGKTDKLGFMRHALGSPQTYDLMASVRGF